MEEKEVSGTTGNEILDIEPEAEPETSESAYELESELEKILEYFK